MLYFFTLNTAPLGVIEKHVKLLNMWFVYVRQNECCNKWASVFVIVLNYAGCNNSVNAEPVCSPPPQLGQDHRISAHLIGDDQKQNFINKRFQSNSTQKNK